ncbi:MAG: DNA alkylation repair protein [Candidatus Limnocylindrales bacterium]
MTGGSTLATPSPATARATALVTALRPRARALGQRVGGLIEDPERFERELARGLRALADPVYAAAQARIAPGVGAVIGVRWPLLEEITRALREPLREASPAVSIYLAERLARAETQEIRLFSHVPLARSLPDDPERSWQLMRRLARRASDWVSVDSLAHLVAQGILLEPYRWAELEQLVYSPHRMERRLVGSSIATLPFELKPADREARLARAPALELLGSLIGDDEPDVRKALAWALRSWRQVDPVGTAAFLRAEAATAVAATDGNRAWVIRDALTGAGADRALAAELRAALIGVRRSGPRGNTSRAYAAAVAFRSAGLPDAQALAEVPV